MPRLAAKFGAVAVVAFLGAVLAPQALADNPGGTYDAPDGSTTLRPR